MAAGRVSQRPRRASRGRGEADQKARNQASETQDQVQEQEDRQSEDRSGNDSGGGLVSELKSTASEAALAVLAPAAKQAATQVAKYALKKGPELMAEKVMPKLDEAGGPGGIADMLKDGGGGLMEKLGGVGEDGGGDAGDGTGKGRRMPIQQSVDVAAPIDIVYDQFTQFEDWPKFMHRVERVEQSDESTVTFHEKIWGFRRQWEAEIVEEREDERIVWESVSGMQHVGVVTFHELAERLTRIELNIDIDPSGPIEKIARGARFAKRAARADLKRFKAYVEMHEDEAYEDEPRDDDAEYEDEMEAPPDEEMEAEPEEDMESEPEPAEEEEPEEKPKRRQPARSRSSSNGNSKSANGSSRSSKSKSTASHAKSKSSGGSSSRGRSGGSTSRSRSRSSSSNGNSKSTRSTTKAKSKS